MQGDAAWVIPFFCVKALRVILTVVLGWLALKGGEVMVRSNSVDRAIFEGSGLGWLFWVLATGIMLLLAVAFWYLWRPSGAGYRIAQAALVLHFAESAVGAALGFRDPGRLRDAVVASRAARGLTVRPELLEALGSPWIHALALAFALLVTAVALILLFCFERARRAPERPRVGAVPPRLR